MKIKFFLFSLFALLNICLQAQTEQFILDATSAGEGKIVRRATFDGNSLWGYINGGADIYLEYGFNSVQVYEIDFRGGTIRFDLYRMNDPLAAFGIFSVYSFRCDSTAGPGRFNCATKWQIQSAGGEYYLSVILPSGSREEYVYAYAIATKLMDGIEKDPFPECEIFSGGAFSNIRGRIQYARGMLGIDNGIAFNGEMLRDINFKELWQITDIENRENLSVTAITFDSAAELDKFIGRMESELKDDSNKRIFRHLDGTTAIITDNDSEQSDSSIVSQWFRGIRQ